MWYGYISTLLYAFLYVYALLYLCTLHDCTGGTCVLVYFYVCTALRISCITYWVQKSVD